MVEGKAIVTDDNACVSRELIEALVAIDAILIKMPHWDATAVLAALSELYNV